MAKKTLNSQKDIQQSKRMSQETGKDYAKFELGDNFVIFLSPDFEDGKKHFLRVEGVEYTRVVTCNYNMDDDSDKIDQCSGCNHVNHIYEEAKRYKDEHEEEHADKLRKLAYSNRASYSAVMLGVKGYITYSRKRGSEDIVPIPTFEDQPVQKIPMDAETFDKLKAVIAAPTYEDITQGDHLVGYIINFVVKTIKGKRGGEYNKVTDVIPIKPYTGNLKSLISESAKFNLDEEFPTTANADIEKIIDGMKGGETSADFSNDFEDSTDLDDFSDADFVDVDQAAPKKKSTKKKKAPAKKKKQAAKKKTAVKKKPATKKKKPAAKKKANKKTSRKR